jgi:four helix bundle protein
MKQEDFNEEFRKRTKQLALDIIKMVAPLKYSDALGIIRKQLIDACTSVASNFRASCRARSQRELFSKLSIVVEEADETLFWLELLVEGEFIPPEVAAPKQKETLEILSVMSAYRKKVGSTL